MEDLDKYFSGGGIEGHKGVTYSKYSLNGKPLHTIGFNIDSSKQKTYIYGTADGDKFTTKDHKIFDSVFSYTVGENNELKMRMQPIESCNGTIFKMKMITGNIADYEKREKLE